MIQLINIIFILFINLVIIMRKYYKIICSTLTYVYIYIYVHYKYTYIFIYTKARGRNVNLFDEGQSMWIEADPEAPIIFYPFNDNIRLLHGILHWNSIGAVLHQTLYITYIRKINYTHHKFGIRDGKKKKKINRCFLKFISRVCYLHSLAAGCKENCSPSVEHTHEFWMYICTYIHILNTTQKKN